MKLGYSATCNLYSIELQAARCVRYVYTQAGVWCLRNRPFYRSRVSRPGSVLPPSAATADGTEGTFQAIQGPSLLFNDHLKEEKKQTETKKKHEE